VYNPEDHLAGALSIECYDLTYRFDDSLMKMSKAKQDVMRYVLGAAAAVAALLLRDMLSPFLGHQNPYHTMWLAVVFCAWYCGIGPSIFAIVIGATGVWYWFLKPYHSFAGKTQVELSGMLGFFVLSGVIVALGESTRRLMAKRQNAEEELKRAQEKLEDRVRERTAELEEKTADAVEKAVLLDLANDAIFVKTASGTISYWNQGAERLYGWTMSEALGHVPAELLRSQYPIPLREIEASDVWEGELQQTTRDGSRIVVASRWTTLRDASGNPTGWLEINTDITGRKRAEQAARSLSGRILTLQDDERRRIARGLHDSLGQYLTALKMNLDLLSMKDGSQAAVAAECSEMAEKCLAETRTVSHLLHPPLLDEAGFGSAARWFVDGFAQRSGIKVDLSLPPSALRLRQDAEIALFRALQEGLTNVHRHSGGEAVDIRFSLAGDAVRLEIKDDGHGIPRQTLQRLIDGGVGTGVGLAGMRERMRELHGALEIESDSAGTLLRVSIPVSEAMEKQVNGHETTKQRISAA
jgi:PAS domain S-box-containing protein